MKVQKTRVKKEKKVKETKARKSGKRPNMLTSIIGRLMILGLISFLATLVLGGAGVLQLNSNNKNTTLLNSVNKINLLQNTNTAAETTFRYTLNYSSNAEIVKNLTTMQDQVAIAKANAGKNYQSKVSSIEGKIKSIKEAMLVLSDSYIERGLKEEDGLYAEFLQYDEQLVSSFGALPTEVYWSGLLDDVNENFHNYSMAVAEGADTEELSQKVLSSISSLIDKAMGYAMSNRAAEGVISLLEQKRAAFDTVAQYDAKIINSKSMVNSLNADLTYYCTELQELVAKDAEAALVSMTVLIVSILIGSAVVIMSLTFFVSKGVQKSIRAFEGTLSEIAGGDMTVAAKTNSGNEFDAFGVSLNKMTEVLHGTLDNVNTIATEVNSSGNGLQSMAESTSTISNQVSTTIDQIASGATTQAEDVEQSAMQMAELGRFMSNIVTNVADLDETAVNMANAGAAAADIMKELDASNDKMTEGIGKISAQISKTNDSVQSIKNATSMIASIASQTNLLSLNAAIEAARAGDAGRGFAVVASEIQQLADQSNKSASDIDKVINTLIADFKETLSVMAEVEATTTVQNEKLTDTREKFDIVSDGINATKDKTVEIRNAIEECNKVQQKVDQLISNLSAISEEYAASTTEAAQSMSELNDTITQLLGESNKLIEISETLENSMKAFTL